MHLVKEMGRPKQEELSLFPGITSSKLVALCNRPELLRYNTIVVAVCRKDQYVAEF
jgi:hypothetical protein